jgi:ligand-binding sensor domain-containing protein/signal transduction histidine kinase
LLLKNLSTSPDGRLTKHWLLKCVLSALALLSIAVAARAGDTQRLLSQYLHEHWGSEKGFPEGSVTAISQSDDGYLWIGTDKGLLRFDGVSFRGFAQAIPTTFAIGPVRSMAADAEGNLWIVLQSTKILRYHDGKFEIGAAEAEFGITSVGKRSDGTIVFASLAFGPLAYRAGKFDVLSVAASENPAVSYTKGNGDSLSSHLSWATGVTAHHFAEPNSAVVTMAETSDGKLWLGTQDKGLFYLQDGKVTAPAAGFAVRKINCLLPLKNGEIWIGTDDGVLRWAGSEGTRAGVPAVLAHGEILSAIRDRDSNIWVGTRRGLYRISATSGGTAENANRSAAGGVSALFQDREGNVWVGSSHGIDRLRGGAFATFTASEGLASENDGSLFIDNDHRIWIAPLDGGLQLMDGTRSRAITDASLNRDVIYSISGGSGELWIGRQQGGLTHLQYNNGGVTRAQTYLEKDGLAQNSVYVVKQTTDGAVWAGTLSGGVSKFENGHFQNFTVKDGLASDTVTSIAGSSEQTMWFGTPKGLTAFSAGHWTTYGVAEDLPSAVVNCLYQDSEQILWIGTASGLARYSAGHVQTTHDVPASLTDQILGITEDRFGWLWIATSNHVLRVSREKLLHGSIGNSDIHEYGTEDGLLGTEGVKRPQSVFAEANGRIWFSMNRGLSAVDPARAITNPAPALVHIESISADGSPIQTSDNIKIPSASQRVTFRFIGLSLAAPERIRYRYMLDGFDHGWSEPASTRDAIYTNLKPGGYRFHVIASNSDGVWNEDGTSVALTIVPAFYQTSWFLLFCIFAVAVLSGAAYQWHVREVTARLDLQFKERLSERTRIARELHDTLLQSFQGLMLHFQRVRNLLPANPAEAMKRLDSALEGAEQAIIDGRNAIQDIRSATLVDDNLAQAIKSLGEELHATDGATEASESEISLNVMVEGDERPLDPLARDEIYRIVREALRNSYRHADATSIEAEIIYAPDVFRVRVRDDGRGINPTVVEEGRRAGHWGLPGMRERALKIGGQLALWSELGAGTEVELTVPGSVVYRSSTASASTEFSSNKKARVHE